MIMMEMEVIVMVTIDDGDDLQGMSYLSSSSLSDVLINLLANLTIALSAKSFKGKL